jgi:Zn-dependent protease
MNKLNAILNWSVRVGKLFGIPISLHISILFFLWPVLSSRREDPLHALEYAFLVVVSILLHELGHALTAKRYKLSGLSIMLHGFGGFATSSGDKGWKQSLVITLAGPATTLILGMLCLGLGNLGVYASTFGTEQFEQCWLIYSIGWLNILLGFLNMIPSFPFDGGNALRAILNRTMTHVKAVRAVGHLGLVISPLLIIYWLVTKDSFVGLFGLMGTISSAQILLGTGGIRFGEMFADRKYAQEMAAQRKREVAKKQAYLDEVRNRTTERADNERLRKLFDVVDGDQK